MNIRVDLNTPIKDGTEVVFRSPVDCSQITGLIVYYQENGNTASKEFALADANGNNVGDIDHLFAEDVVVKVILDVKNSMAFVQNADTNAYLEHRMGRIAHPVTGDEFNNLALEEKLVPGDAYVITEDCTHDDMVTKGKIFRAKDRVNFDYLMSVGGSADGAVLYTEQTLTPEQQEQAMANIGAAPMSLFKVIEGDVVVHDMLEPEKFTSGTLIDGGKRYENRSDYSVTDFIDIADAKQIYCYFYAGSAESKYKLPRLHFYSENAEDKYLSSAGNTTEYEFTEYNGIHCVEIAKPQNANYMIVCLPTADTDNNQHHLMFVESGMSSVEIPGLVPPNGTLRYTEQTLTTEQQEQARHNIGAAPMSMFNTIYNDVVVHEMLEPEKFTSGLIDAGKRYENESYAVTDFIDISEVSQLYCYFYEGKETKYSLPRFHFYTDNVDAAYISTYGNTTEYEFTECDGIPCVEIPKPDCAKYLIVCLNVSVVNQQIHHLMFVESEVCGVEIPGLIVPGADIPEPVIPNPGTSDDISEEINGIIADKDSVSWTRGYLDYNTGSFVSANDNSEFITTDFIPVPKGRYCIEASGVRDNGDAVNTVSRVFLYDESYNFIKYIPTDRVADISLADDITYIRVTLSVRTINYFTVYDFVLGKENVTALKEDVLIPRLDNKVNNLCDKANRVGATDTGYVRGRRPLVAFIFDGDWDLNATFEELFWRHKAPIGFAIQYTTPFANHSKEQYLEWERKGHEILVHGNYVLRSAEDGGNVSSVEQGKQYIKDSYVTMRTNGFNPVGYVASGGELDKETYVPTLKRYYEWAATVYNHAGTAQSHYVYGETKPYELWRYNMHGSTLEQMKKAIDDTIATNSVLVLFGHAQSDWSGSYTDTNHFNLENMEALLSYIETKEIDMVRPSEAIKDFFSVRYEELLSLLNE